MEQKLFTLLSRNAYYCGRSHYLLELATAISVFLEPNVNKKLTAGYGGGIYEREKVKNKYLNEINALLPENTEYGRIYINNEDIYSIEQLFDGGVETRLVHYADNSPYTKGYAFRLEYYFKSTRDTSKEAEAMLQYMIKILTNNELKLVSEKIYAQQIKEANERAVMEEEEKRQQAIDKEERKRKYDEEHIPKYEAIKKKANDITIPTRKKNALTVKPQDFDAIAYKVKPYDYDAYPSNYEAQLKQFFRNGDIRIWMPNDVLHCYDPVQDEEYTVRDCMYYVTMVKVYKRKKEEPSRDNA